ncbi:MAG: hypothetical protein KatS3mg043_1499 [Rhodothermaceae bacterium]|nr:MAG: hypothetical protein KatS3mg043_1499 [Rhodothermaceae bacterium]
MALRLVEFTAPAGFTLPADVTDAHGIAHQNRLPLATGDVLVRILLDADRAEGFTEWLHEEAGLRPNHRIVLLPVEATVPRLETPGEHEAPPSSSPGRISRDELYEDVNDAVSVTGAHYALVVLSTIVAAGGMLRDSVAIVIGAMVIAPLIGPNIALALGTTLGDRDLLGRAFRINVLGLLLGLALSVGAGLVFEVDLQAAEIASRTQVQLGDLLLALAAGVAGALSMTRGYPSALIGVMVAVALLPPLVALGMLLGAGRWDAAYGAALLLLTNVVSINLAAVATFLVQGIRPMRWFEAEQARKATRLAIGLWVLALALLVAAILLSPDVKLPAGR